MQSLISFKCDNCGKEFSLDPDTVKHRKALGGKFNYCSELCRSKLYRNMQQRKDVMEFVNNEKICEMGITVRKLCQLGFVVKIQWGQQT